MYEDQMHCQIVVGVFERTVADVDEFATLETLCVIPPIPNQDPDPNMHENPIPEHTKPAGEPDGGPEYPLDPELEPDREPDMFDNEEEYVGVDDEAMYMPVPYLLISTLTMPRLLIIVIHNLLPMLMQMMVVLLKEVILLSQRLMM
jgi:hypothetical protein